VIYSHICEDDIKTNLRKMGYKLVFCKYCERLNGFQERRKFPDELSFARKILHHKLLLKIVLIRSVMYT
jgi:hypothetical protein